MRCKTDKRTFYCPMSIEADIDRGVFKSITCFGDTCMAWVQVLGDEGYCGMVHGEALRHDREEVGKIT